MRVLSVNVGEPREVLWKEKTFLTGIFKVPSAGAVRLRQLNLDGDRQADLKVHGGSDKAAYGYPSEHYDFWRPEYPDLEISWGVFGENFTTEGMLEDSVNIGDQFQIGSSQVVVTQPRMPCFKLGIRFGRMEIVKRFLASRRSGFYFGVVQEGEVCAGCEIRLVHREVKGVSVLEAVNLYVSEKPDLGLLERAVDIEALSLSWKNHFLRALENSRT